MTEQPRYAAHLKLALATIGALSIFAIGIIQTFALAPGTIDGTIIWVIYLLVLALFGYDKLVDALEGR